MRWLLSIIEISIVYCELASYAILSYKNQYRGEAVILMLS